MRGSSPLKIKGGAPSGDNQTGKRGEKIGTGWVGACDTSAAVL